MTSLVHYTKTGSAASDQKAGFATLSKIVSIWVSGKVLTNGHNSSPAKNGPTSPDLSIPGIQQFFYDNVVPLCFELPLRKDFDYSDAASYQVSWQQLCQFFCSDRRSWCSGARRDVYLP